jgi:hypothetical protein
MRLSTCMFCNAKDPMPALYHLTLRRVSPCVSYSQLNRISVPALPKGRKYHAFSISPQLFVPCTANRGPVRIQYKCLVQTKVFPEMKPEMKQKHTVLLNFHIHVYVSYLYTVFPGSVCLFCCSQIGRPILGKYKLLTDT